MENNDDILTSAINSLYKRATLFYKSPSHAFELHLDKKEPIAQVLDTCKSYFDSITQILNEGISPFSQVNNKLLIHLIEDTLPRKKHLNGEGYKPSTTYLSQHFAPFEVKHLQKVLTPSEDIISILPYLLGAYYFNTHTFLDNGYPACFRLLDGGEYENGNRMALDFSSLFSLENLIPDFIKKKHSEKAKVIQKIKDFEQYSKYLSCPQQKRSKDKKLVYALVNLQYEAIFQAFSYSLCVLACMSSPQISEQVDYMLSFDLFQRHTAAFSTVFSIYNTTAHRLDGDHIVHLSATIMNLLTHTASTEIQQRIEDSEFSDKLGMCGVLASHISDCDDPFLNDWYKNAAALIVRELHPCEYSEWWHFKHSDFLAGNILHFLPYMDLIGKDNTVHSLDIFLEDYRPSMYKDGEDDMSEEGAH